MPKLLLILVLVTFPWESQGGITLLTLTGEPAPGGAGTFVSTLGNDQISLTERSVAIATRVDSGGTQLDVILVGNSFGPLTTLAIEGEVLPNANILDTLLLGSVPVTNASGRVAFPAQDPSAALTELITGTAAGVDVQIVVEGDAPPEGNGQLELNLPPLEPAVNASGSVALSAQLFGTSGGSTDDQALYRWDGALPLVKIVRKGDVVPGGTATFAGTFFQSTKAFGPPFLIDDGRVAFAALLENSGVAGDDGVFVSEGGTPTEFVRTGDMLPNNDPVVSIVHFDFNQSGQLAFMPHNAFDTNADGVYRTDGSKTFVEIADIGTTAPDGRIFYGFDSNVVKQDEAGRSVFAATVRNASFVLRDGIFVGDGSGIPTQLALDGTPSPEGHGDFVNLIGATYTISPGGQIAFQGWTLGPDNQPFTADDAVAIYRFSTSGLEEIVSTEDQIDGADVDTLALAGVDDAPVRGINDCGEIAFKFELSDAREGTAIWAPDPLPAGCAPSPAVPIPTIASGLLAIALLGVGAIRARAWTSCG